MKRNLSQAGIGLARSGRQGFTLIELLVVVSIIALLIAILLPALSGAKQQANKAACAAKLSGLNKGILTYLSEYDNAFPLNGMLFPKDHAPTGSAFAALTAAQGGADSNPQHWQPQFGKLWDELSIGATKDALTATSTSLVIQSVYIKYFMCPADDRQRSNPAVGAGSGNPALYLDGAGVIQQGAGSPGYWSYSINAVLNSLGRFRYNFAPTTSTPLPWADPMKMSQILNQSDFIFLLEEDDKSLFNDEVFDPPAYNGGDLLTNRHMGQGNVSFADGHVESFPQIQFDNVPSGGGGNANQIALKSPITRKFFPDNGIFGQ